MRDELSVEAHHTKFAEFHEGYVRHYIALADTKASLIFGASSALSGYLLVNKAFRSIANYGLSSFTSVSAILAAVLLMVGSLFAIAVIMPRLPRGAEGIVFFGAVSRYKNSGEYLELVKAQTEDRLTSARIEHCYGTSKICSKKYKSLRTSMWLSAIGLVFLIPPLIEMGK